MKVSLSTSSSKHVRPFLLKFGLFLLLLVLVDWSLGTVIEQLYRRSPRGANWTKVNWLLRERFDVVIFGSSRAFRHYVPSVISEELGLSVFNAGQNGQYMLYSYAVEQLLLAQYAPKAIVLDVLPGFIVRAENGDEEVERLSSLSPFIGNKSVRRLLTRDDFFEKVKYASKMFRFNSKILSIAENLRTGANNVDNGFEQVGDVKFHDRNPFDIDLMQQVEIDSFKLGILQDFIASARARNIAVYASFSPVSEPLSERTADVMRVYKDIFAAAEVPFLDFATAAYEDKSLFIDLTHMDGIGAERFSREFGHVFSQVYAAGPNALALR